MTAEEILATSPELAGRRLIAEEGAAEEEYYERRRQELRERRRKEYEERGGPEVRHSEPIATVRAMSAPASRPPVSREVYELAKRFADDLAVAGKSPEECDKGFAAVCASPTLQRDLRLTETLMEAAGKLIGKLAAEHDRELKKLREDISGVRAEIESLKAGRLRAVA